MRVDTDDYLNKTRADNVPASNMPVGYPPSVFITMFMLARASECIADTSPEMTDMTDILDTISATIQMLRLPSGEPSGDAYVGLMQRLDLVLDDLQAALLNLETLFKWSPTRLCGVGLGGRSAMEENTTRSTLKDILRQLERLAPAICNASEANARNPTLTSNACHVPEPATNWSAMRISRPRSRMLDWLSSSASELRHSELSRQRPCRTGEWLWKMPEWTGFVKRQEPAVIWVGVEPEKRILWLHGKPGSGKSMLTCALVEKLRRDVLGPAGEAAIFYYFDSRSRSSVYGAVASLLRQVLYHPHIPIPQNLAVLWENLETLEIAEGAKRRLGFQQAISDLLSLLPRFRRIFVCLDGLDECDNEQELMMLLRKLIASPCQLLVTSRSLARFRVILQSTEQIVQTDLHNGADIEMLAKDFSDRLSARALGIDPGIVSEIRHKLVSNSKGSFLTMQLAMSELSSQETVYDTERCARELPHDILELCKIQVRRLKQQSIKRAELANRVLAWMAYAQRPLGFLELQQAIVIETGELGDCIDSKRYSPPDLIEEVCMGLVTVDSASNIVTTTRTSLLCCLREFRNILFPEGQNNIAECLVAFLRRLSQEKVMPGDKQYEDLIRRLPFAVYVAQFWGFHLVGHEDGRTLDRLPQAVWHTHALLAQILHVSLGEDPRDSTAYPSNFSATHLAAYFGLPIDQIPDFYLEINQTDSWGRTPLHLCCQNVKYDWGKLHFAPASSAGLSIVGTVECDELSSSSSGSFSDESGTSQSSRWFNSHLNNLQTILEQKEDRSTSVNAQDQLLKTPLHYAAISGDHDVVRQLLHEHPALHLMDTSSRTALDYAVESGRIDIVDLIVSSSADGSLTDEPNALSIAAANRFRDILHLFMRVGLTIGKDRAFLEATKSGHYPFVKLLFRPAAIKYQDPEGKTALHHAVLNPNLDIVFYLLGRKCDVNRADNHGRVPLWYVAGIGDLDMAIVLLSVVDAHAYTTDNDGQGPLYQATANRHKDMVQLLTQQRRQILVLSKKQTVGDKISKEAQVSAAFELACRQGFHEIAETLLDQVDPDAKGKDGRTPLSYAVEGGHASIVRMLLDTNLVNVDPSTLQLANKKGHEHVVRILLSGCKNTGGKRGHGRHVHGLARDPQRREIHRLSAFDHIHGRSMEPGGVDQRDFDLLTSLMSQILDTVSDISPLIETPNVPQMILNSVLDVQNILHRARAQVESVRETFRFLDSGHRHVLHRGMESLSSTLRSYVVKLDSMVLDLATMGRFKYLEPLGATEPRQVLKGLMDDMKRWQRRFNSAWLLILRLDNPAIDGELNRLHLVIKRVSASAADGKDDLPAPKNDIFTIVGRLNNWYYYESLVYTYTMMLSPTALDQEEIALSDSTLEMGSDDQDRRVVQTVSRMSDGDELVLQMARDMALKLRHMDPDVCGLLSCKGVFQQPVKGSEATSDDVNIVFRLPCPANDVHSLRQALLRRDVPEMRQKLHLARSLARSIAFLQIISIPCASLRPESIVLIQDRTSDGHTPFPVGFRVRGRDSTSKSACQKDLAELIYWHPTRQEQVIIDASSHCHDVYSLGVCLLEIGLWESLVEYPPDAPPQPGRWWSRPEALTGPDVAKDELYRIAVKALPQRMGTKYTDAVVNCLEFVDKGRGDPGSMSTNTKPADDRYSYRVALRFIESVMERLDGISI